MKKANTRRSLLLSALSLLLCVSMLIGTTFAWFTDEVKSGVNKIEAGNLDIELYHGKEAVPTTNKVEDATNIFTDPTGNKDILWEPGVVAWTNLKVANEGSLALKYELAINFDNATTNANGDTLAKVLKVGFVTGGIESTARADVLAEVTQWKDLASFVQPGTLEKEKNDIYGIVIYWEPSNIDNEFNLNNGQTGKMQIDLGITLVATQKDAEFDSFGDDYDEGAVKPIPVNPLGNTVFTYEGFSFDIPAGAIDPDAGALTPSEPKPVIKEIIPTDTTTTKKVSISFDLKINGLKEGNTTPITVKYPLPAEANEDYTSNVEVYHNGVKIDGATYDPATRIVTFQTTSFSPFEIVLDTGAIVIPESYTNDEAVAMLKNAASGAVIDGLGKKITFPDSVQNGAAGFTIGTKSLTLRNMTITAGGKGYSLQVDAKNQTVVFQNVTFTTTRVGFTSPKGAVELSVNGKKSVLFENCTFEQKAYIQGSNITFKNCTFNVNNNLESASNVTFEGCTLKGSSAITMNSGIKNILIQDCTFTGNSGIKLYSGMVQPTNVQLINNTYKKNLVGEIGTNVDLDAWKAAGAWVEENNVKG